MAILAIIAALVAAGSEVAQESARRAAKGWGGSSGGAGAFGGQDSANPAAAGVGLAGNALQGIASLYSKAKGQNPSSTYNTNTPTTELDSYMGSKGWEIPSYEGRMGDPNLEFKQPGPWLNDYVFNGTPQAQLSAPYNYGTLDRW